MRDHEDIIKAYIDRIMRVKDGPSMTQADLDGIARELGLTKGDFSRIRAAVDDHRGRGTAFLNSGYFAESISELEKALSLRPVDPDLMHELADAHFRCARKTGDGRQLGLAETYSRRVIELDSKHKASFALLESIAAERGKRRLQRLQRTKKLAVAAAGGITLCALILAIIFILAPGAGSGSTAATQAVSPAQIQPEEKPYAPPAPLRETERRVSVQFVPTAESEGIEFAPQSSVLMDMGKSYSYTMRGSLLVKKDELSRVRLKLECLDASNRLVASKYIEALMDHEPAVRPGDTILAGALIYEQKPAPDVRLARVSIDYTKRGPAQSEYSPDPSIPLSWEVKEQGVDLAAFERSSRMTTLGNASVFLTLCLQNTGKRPLSIVKLKLDWYDKSGGRIASEVSYAFTDSMSAQLPVGARIARLFIGKFPAGVTEYDRYAVTVAEAH